MKLLTSLSASLLVLTLGLTAAAGAADPKATPKTDAEIIADARATYPLKTCLVSGEPLGSMGEAAGSIHRAPGQPPRVIFVCCEGCIDDFKAEPAKFLQKVDAAAAAAKGAKGKKA